MRVDVGQANLDFRDPLRIGRVLGFGEQAGTLGVGRKHPIEQAVVAARRFLRDVAEAGVARDRDRSVVGRHLTFEKTQQCRLAGAVAPDEADLVAGGDRDSRLLEDRPSLDPIGQIVDMQHGTSR